MANSKKKKKTEDKVARKTLRIADVEADKLDEKAICYEEIMGKRRTQVYYQPIVDVVEQKVLSVETLSRCPKTVPVNGVPFVVIDKKDHSELDQICLENITKGVRKYKGDSPLIFINCLLENIDHLRGLLSPEEKGKYVVEFDLNYALFDVEHFLEKVRILREESFLIAIDDIGETLTDPELLRVISPSFLKIDMSIVQGIHENPEAQNYVKDVMKLGDELGANIIAEGVETKEELETMTSLGCRYIQGYYFCKPGPLIPEEEDIFAEVEVTPFKKAV